MLINSIQRNNKYRLQWNVFGEWAGKLDKMCYLYGKGKTVMASLVKRPSNKVRSFFFRHSPYNL